MPNLQLLGYFCVILGVFGRARLKGSKHELTSTEPIQEHSGQPSQKTQNRQPLNMPGLSFLLTRLSPEHYWQPLRVSDYGSK